MTDYNYSYSIELAKKALPIWLSHAPQDKIAQKCIDTAVSFAAGTASKDDLACAYDLMWEAAELKDGVAKAAGRSIAAATVFAVKIAEKYFHETNQREQADLLKCPECKGPADNGFDRGYPPSPYVCTGCEPQREEAQQQ